MWIFVCLLFCIVVSCHWNYPPLKGCADSIHTYFFSSTRQDYMNHILKDDIPAKEKNMYMYCLFAHGVLSYYPFRSPFPNQEERKEFESVMQLTPPVRLLTYVHNPIKPRRASFYPTCPVFIPGEKSNSPVICTCPIQSKYDLEYEKEVSRRGVVFATELDKKAYVQAMEETHLHKLNGYHYDYVGMIQKPDFMSNDKLYEKAKFCSKRLCYFNRKRTRMVCNHSTGEIHWAPHKRELEPWDEFIPLDYPKFEKEPRSIRRGWYRFGLVSGALVYGGIFGLIIVWFIWFCFLCYKKRSSWLWMFGWMGVLYRRCCRGWSCYDCEIFLELLLYIVYIPLSLWATWMLRGAW